MEVFWLLLLRLIHVVGGVVWVGAITTVVAMIVGISMGAVSEKKMAEIGQRLRAERREPTPDEAARLEFVPPRFAP